MTGERSSNGQPDYPRFRPPLGRQTVKPRAGADPGLERWRNHLSAAREHRPRPMPAPARADRLAGQAPAPKLGRLAGRLSQPGSASPHAAYATACTPGGIRHPRESGFQGVVGGDPV